MDTVRIYSQYLKDIHTFEIKKKKLLFKHVYIYIYIFGHLKNILYLKLVVLLDYVLLMDSETFKKTSALLFATARYLFPNILNPKLKLKGLKA